MAGTFDPTPDGKWDPDRPARELTAFAVTMVLTDELRSVLAIESKDGKRHDFIMSIDDAREIAYTLLGAADQAEQDGPRIRAMLALAADDAVIPYGPN